VLRLLRQARTRSVDGEETAAAIRQKKHDCYDAAAKPGLTISNGFQPLS
jgi:hypothetical protein